MERNEQVREVLNDLIRINHDRIEGYEKAIQDSRNEDADLQAVFSRMADESKQYASELEREVARTGDDPAEGTTAAGKIYRVWMDIRAAFSGKSRQTVLDLCEYGEDAAQRAYEAALKADAELPGDVRQLISNQKTALKTSHDTIKRYRDSQEGRRSE